MLTVRQIESLTKPGKHADGNNLYLDIKERGTKSWIFRYQLHGKRHEMGLGAYPLITLKQARETASDYRKLLSKGTDPKGHRDSQAHISRSGNIWTFDRCSAAYIEDHRTAWKNAKHTSQWTNTLKTYASPTIGKLPVNQVDIELVIKILKPIWTTKPETASRVRQRIEKVLAWAIVHRHREGPNPATWRGNLDNALPKPSKLKQVKHHSALPYSQISGFMTGLRKKNSQSAKALQLTILSGCRTSEVLNAKWDEFDLSRKIWTIPADRMKSRREHRVPLSGQVTELLKNMDKESGSNWLFPGRKGEPISNMAMLNLLKKQMGCTDLTVHGFRSTFRDWAAEVSHHPREIAEAALAHVLTNQTEAAYQRGDLLEKRRTMMQEWADFIDTKQS
ncbi:MAG: integrase arm-type DNA-binding domain-containing protein [Sedimenticola sp.]